MAHKLLLSEGHWLYNFDYPVGEMGMKRNFNNDVLLFQTLHNIGFGELQNKFGVGNFKEWLVEDGIYGPKTKTALLTFLKVAGKTDYRMDPIFNESQSNRALWQLNWYASRNTASYYYLPFTSRTDLSSLATPGVPPLDSHKV